MKRNGKAKLSIRRETLRKLAAGDLAQAAGGVIARFCTYHPSGCVGGPTGGCLTDECATEDCGGGGQEI